jgi:hypothetical protein
VLRRFLPEQHLAAESKDVIKLAMGLVATMSALLLGLLVSSAKGSYDAERNQVIQMAAKITFLERVLTLYGPEAADTRAKLSATIQDAVGRIWSEEKTGPGQVNFQAAESFFSSLQALSPRDDAQRILKAQASSLAIDLGQLRSLLIAQSVSSISLPLLVMVVCWLMVIFASFSMLAPPNATVRFALLVSACSVAGAIFLILELDHPFQGLIQISRAPVLNALNQLAQ